MSEKNETVESLPPDAGVVGIANAPIVLVDGISGTGIYASSILQIELTANVIEGFGQTQKFLRLQTAHLRCSIAGARLLRMAIDDLLANFERPEGPAN